jgi:hypothetical protein
MKTTLVSVIATCSIIGSLPAMAEENRLTDPKGNRCGDNQISYAECPTYLDYAWNGGAGCINATEYNYAKANSIAPICSPLNRATYIGWCRCGCFEKSTKLFLYDVQRQEGSWQTVEGLPGNTARLGAYTLADGATLGDMSRTVHAILDTTVGPEEKPLVVIRTEGGSVLGLTEMHAVLLASGFMVRAAELTTDSVVVNMNGQAERIVEITRVPTRELVYNLLTDAGLENKQGHLVFAEGIVVGDIYWQNIVESELRELTLRQ